MIGTEELQLLELIKCEGREVDEGLLHEEIGELAEEIIEGEIGLQERSSRLLKFKGSKDINTNGKFV